MAPAGGSRWRSLSDVRAGLRALARACTPRSPAGPRRTRARCAGAVAALIDRYPREFAALADDWAKDASVREQLWALTTWREHLDVGTYGDPRIELAFAWALQDFEAYTRERARASLRGRR